MSRRFFKSSDTKQSSNDNLNKVSHKSLQRLMTELELPVNIKKEELIEIIRNKKEIKINTSEHDTRSWCQKSRRSSPLHCGHLKVYQPNKPKNAELVANKKIILKRTNDCIRNQNVHIEIEPSTSSNRLNEKASYKTDNKNTQDGEQKIGICTRTYSTHSDLSIAFSEKPSSANNNGTYVKGIQEKDTVTYKNNDVTERKENTKCSEAEGILAFADFVIQIDKENKQFCSTKDVSSFEIPSKSAEVPVLEYKMEPIKKYLFIEPENPSPFKIITCPAMSCSRIVRLKTLLKHILWVHPESVSYQVDMTIEIIFSQIRECRKKTYFQTINDMLYITFIECVDDYLHLAIKYLQVANEITKTAVLRIELPNEGSLTWKGRIKGFDQFKMELKDYYIILNLTEFYGNQLITVRTTITDDSY